MKFFLHTPETIRIINEDQEFACTPEEFAALAPAYPGLPDGAVVRYWTPDQQYVGDGNGNLTPDNLDCLSYVLNIATYNTPAIYVHVVLSKTALCVSYPNDYIDFIADIKPSLDPNGDNLPVTQEWYIRMRHEAELTFDAFRLFFQDGACHASYRYQAGIPLGVWRVEERDFDQILVNGQRYQVRLANPVTVTLYRELA